MNILRKKNEKRGVCCLLAVFSLLVFVGQVYCAVSVINTVDSAGDVGFGCSIAVDTTTKVIHISYYDKTGRKKYWQKNKSFSFRQGLY